MSFMPINVNIKNIKLNNIDHTGSLSVSSTIKKNRNVSAKKNQGFGQQLADGTLRILSTSAVIDNEIQDSCSYKMNKN